MSIDQFLARVRPPIDTALEQILPPPDREPAVLHEAMRYSVLGGGKRLRPALCLAAYQVFRPDWEAALPVAASIELIHTYSLIHDDLPAMDDDDFRRGRLSCHRKFGEAVAILAGDALLTLAFGTIAGARQAPAELLLGVSRILAGAAGTEGGMIAGQVLDLEAERQAPDQAQLESIHRAKTGALLAASVSAGAHLARASERQMATVTEFGRKIGLAFQIIDDLLDESAPVEVLGKTPGKDRIQGKATYPRVHGIDASRAIASRVTGEARDAALSLGGEGQLLADFADHLHQRIH